VYRIFTDAEIEDIRQVRLYDVIVNSTDIKPDDIQKHVFFWLNGDPCPQPVQLNTSLLEPCKYLQGYDYFEVGLEVQFFFIVLHHFMYIYKDLTRILSFFFKFFIIFLLILTCV
jgi:dual oxidase